jgi:2-iminobutanoate/2-iminopropanoate deaminase
MVAITLLSWAARPPVVLAAESSSSPQFYLTPGAAGASLPFSEAVRFGDTLYLSGQIGVVPGTTTLVAGGIGAEARQAMDNIKATLVRHGSSLDQVIKCTVFLADIKDWPAFNEVYRGYFTGHFPARSAFATTGLAFNARVEVECLAVAPK